MSVSRVFDNVLEAIGDTPIVRLHATVEAVERKTGAEFYAKLEFMNPGGSIKDRIGWHLIEEAERKGLLKPGGTLVEGTSGNTGVGLAIAAAIKGYKCIFVLPDKMSEEKIRNLRAFGARVVVTPTAVEPEDPRSYYQVSRRLAKETPNAIYVNQYDNLANREAHTLTTGPEILKQMPDLDVFVAGIGTGGTICGVGAHLRKAKPDAQVVAVDPRGSIVYEHFKFGKVQTLPKTYKIEGIGEDFIPKNYDYAVIDDMIQVEDKESFLMTRDLLTKEGLYTGVSSGSALMGALHWVSKMDREKPGSMKGKKVLVILPDSGNRYLSKVYNDDWMREAGFLEQTAFGSVRDLLASRGTPEILMAKQTDKVSAVIELFKEKDISQVPVTDGKGWIKGIVQEGAILSALYEGRAKPTSTLETVERLIDPSVEYVSIDEPLERVSRLVSSGKVPLIQDPAQNGKLLAIITKIDMLTYIGKKL